MLKEDLRKALLKISAVFALYCSIQPAASVLNTLLLGRPGAGFYILSAILALAGFFTGFFTVKEDSGAVEKLLNSRLADFLQFFFNRKATVRSFLGKAVYITAVVPVAAGMAFSYSTGPVGMVFSSVSFLVFYIVGLRNGCRSFSQMLTYGKIGTGVFLLAAALLTTYFVEAVFPLRTIFLCYSFGFTILAMLVKNQGCIDERVVEKHGRNPGGLPKKIRGFNALTVLAMFFIILLLSNLKTILAAFLKLLAYAAAYATMLFFKLLSLLFYVEEAPEAEAAPPQLPGAVEPGGRGNPYVNFIINVIINFALIYLCYRLAPVLFRSAVRAIRRLAAFLSKLLAIPQAGRDTVINEYSDEIEDIERVSSGRRFQGSGRDRKNIRALNRISDPMLKIRYIYKSVLRLLRGRGVCVNAHDTAGEILEKALALGSIEGHMKEITAAYERVRYGDRVPCGAEVEQALENYKAMARPKKT